MRQHLLERAYSNGQAGVQPCPPTTPINRLGRAHTHPLTSLGDAYCWVNRGLDESGLNNYTPSSHGPCPSACMTHVLRAACSPVRPSACAPRRLRLPATDFRRLSRPLAAPLAWLTHTSKTPPPHLLRLPATDLRRLGSPLAAPLAWLTHTSIRHHRHTSCASLPRI